MSQSPTKKSTETRNSSVETETELFKLREQIKLLTKTMEGLQQVINATQQASSSHLESLEEGEKIVA